MKEVQSIMENSVAIKAQLDVTGRAEHDNILCLRIHPIMKSTNNFSTDFLNR